MMLSGLMVYSLLTVTNKIEITFNPKESWEWQGREGVTVWNQQEQTRHLAFPSQSVVLHTAEHWRNMLLNCVSLRRLEEKAIYSPDCFRNLGLFQHIPKRKLYIYYLQFLIKVTNKTVIKSFPVSLNSKLRRRLVWWNLSMHNSYPRDIACGFLGISVCPESWS